MSFQCLLSLKGGIAMSAMEHQGSRMRITKMISHESNAWESEQAHLTLVGHRFEARPIYVLLL